MDLYFLCLCLCLIGPVYSSNVFERFIKTVNGPSKIECNQASTIVTNDTNNMHCNGKESCLINGTDSNTHFACLKHKESKCKLLTHRYIIEQNGCYKVEIESPMYLRQTQNETLHIFLLQSSMDLLFRRYEEARAFFYFTCNITCRVIPYRDTIFLVKFSNNKKEDFEEFFMEMNQDRITSTEHPTTPATVSMVDVPSVYKGTEHPTTPATVSMVDVTSVYKVSVVNLTLNMIMLVGLMLIYFHRRRSANIKPAKSTNEFPTDKNGKTNTSGTYQLEVRSHLGAVSQSMKQQSAKNPESVNEQINSKDGLKNYTSPWGPRQVVEDRDTTSGACHENVYDDIGPKELVHLNSPQSDNLIPKKVNKGSEANETLYMNSHQGNLIRKENDSATYISMNKPVGKM